MSTRVYRAYEVHLQDPWDFFWEIRDKARANVAANIHRLFSNQKERAPDLSLTEQSTILCDQILTGFGTNERNPFDPEAFIMVYPINGRFFIRLFADERSLITRGCLDFIRDLPEVSDYHYQDCSDQPEDIPEEAWEERRCIWEAAYPSGRLPLSVGLTVCDLHEARNFVYDAALATK